MSINDQSDWDGDVFFSPGNKLSGTFTCHVNCQVLVVGWAMIREEEKIHPNHNPHTTNWIFWSKKHEEFKSKTATPFTLVPMRTVRMLFPQRDEETAILRMIQFRTLQIQLFDHRTIMQSSINTKLKCVIAPPKESLLCTINVWKVLSKLTALFFVHFRWLHAQIAFGRSQGVPFVPLVVRVIIRSICYIRLLSINIIKSKRLREGEISKTTVNLTSQSTMFCVGMKWFSKRNTHPFIIFICQGNCYCCTR